LFHVSYIYTTPSYPASAIICTLKMWQLPIKINFLFSSFFLIKVVTYETMERCAIIFYASLSLIFSHSSLIKKRLPKERLK